MSDVRISEAFLYELVGKQRVEIEVLNYNLAQAQAKIKELQELEEKKKPQIPDETPKKVDKK